MAAANLTHDAHHARGAQRIMDLEPVAEHRRNLARQPQHDPAGVAGAVRGGGVEDRFDIAVVQLRNHGRDQHADRDAGAV